MSLFLLQGLQPNPTNGDTRWNLDYYEYAGDAGTGSNASNSAGIGGFWHPSGRKYYSAQLSGSNGAIIEFDVAVKWDISTIENSGQYVFELATTTDWPRDIHFKPDGTKAYVNVADNTIGSDNFIYEFSLSTAWSMATATVTANIFDPTAFYDADRGSWFTGGYGVSINDAGTVLLCNSIYTDTLYEATMSVAWDLTTAIFTSKSLYISPSLLGDDQPLMFHMVPDGTHLYYAEQNGLFGEWELSTPWDIDTAVFQSRSIDFQTDTGAPIGPFEPNFSHDGMYCVVHEWSGLPTGSEGRPWIRYDYNGTYSAPQTAYDLEYTAQTANSHSYDGGKSIRGLCWKPDGTKVYVTDNTANEVVQYSVSPAWDSSGLTEDKTFDVSAQDTVPDGLFFKSDGTEVYMVGSQNDSVYQYSLSSSWDIGSMSSSGSLSVTAKQGLPTDVHLSSDGTTMIVAGTFGGTSNNSLDRYTLSQAWTLASATHDEAGSLSHMANHSGASYGIWGIDFNTDGTTLIVAGYGPYDMVQQYSLSSAYDLTTLDYQYAKTINVMDGGAGTPTNIRFGNSGAKVYINSFDDQVMYEYDLT